MRAYHGCGGSSDAVVLITLNKETATVARDLFMTRMQDILGDGISAVIYSRAEHALDFL
ncbi:MAG: hypothetical protein WC107_04975 [Patescibacteria group bacterium]